MQIGIATSSRRCGCMSLSLSVGRLRGWIYSLSNWEGQRRKYVHERLMPESRSGVERRKEQRRYIGCAGAIATGLVWPIAEAGRPIATQASQSSRSNPAPTKAADPSRKGRRLKPSRRPIRLVSRVRHLDLRNANRYTEAVLNDLTVRFSMPRPLTFAATAPAAVLDAGRELGRRVRLARIRRRITLR